MGRDWAGAKHCYAYCYYRNKTINQMVLLPMNSALHTHVCNQRYEFETQDNERTEMVCTFTHSILLWFKNSHSLVIPSLLMAEQPHSNLHKFLSQLLQFVFEWVSKVNCFFNKSQGIRLNTVINSHHTYQRNMQFVQTSRLSLLHAGTRLSFCLYFHAFVKVRLPFVCCRNSYRRITRYVLNVLVMAQ